MKNLIAIFVTFSSIAASALTVQQETCETLYSKEDQSVCLQATEYATFSLVHDYMEMAKLKVKQGQSERAIEFIEAAQTAIGLK